MPECRKRQRATGATARLPRAAAATATAATATAATTATATIPPPPPPPVLPTVVLRLSAAENDNNNKDEEEAAKKTDPAADIGGARVLLQQHMQFHRPEENPYLQREKRSACFWCTEGGFQTPYFIPRAIQWDRRAADVYGCFCSPSCALAFLRSEKLEAHVLYDREHLLHAMYPCAAADERIRPAPDPHYLLDKFYGSLSADQFRALSRPAAGVAPIGVLPLGVTKWFPELHEINDATIARFYGGGFRGFRQGVRSRIPRVLPADANNNL